ncbi:erythromycin esterase family protein [Ktedonosporobacter rubrisoli]|uniref:Erythromycin esterase family protein n=1 Tax=Ktedonosporobacter rubrisoli TaxID=2509675 RepID=A0A4P6JTB6_KTERU|nr:erythromycin esterase family protein [Ktedonosporobacter rubrisoli]QBD78674.1 erythromycin esterase family protein [Ktedonosporobacter rubrisoli]
MAAHTQNILLKELQDIAHPLQGNTDNYDPLLELIGNARLVLIGEASHGTHEFYQQRAAITQRLIQEKGFTVVAVEADWPDAYRVNRYVRGLDDDANGREALSSFVRFPLWMWRNHDVLDFIEWLRTFNSTLPAEQKKAGFYGLDLYSLYTSLQSVIAYLDKVDPEAAQRARHRYACFEHFGEDSQAYGYATSFNLARSCEDAVVNQLLELQQHTAEYAKRDGRIAEDDFFYAEQNARLARNAERYYRTMFSGRTSSWNLRDQHMAETLDALIAHLDRSGNLTKAVIWEHNSHLGDARATSMGEEGEYNVGQLVRERHAKETALVGFTTYTGSVTAASDWDEPAEHKHVLPALPESYEALFHATGMPRFMLNLHDENIAIEHLREKRLERAIGVVYLPRTERSSHYFYARLPDQFDAIIHIDRTHALEPLERTSQWVAGEEEAFPSGL